MYQFSVVIAYEKRNRDTLALKLGNAPVLSRAIVLFHFGFNRTYQIVFERITNEFRCGMEA